MRQGVTTSALLVVLFASCGHPSTPPAEMPLPGSVSTTSTATRGSVAAVDGSNEEGAPGSGEIVTPGGIPEGKAVIPAEANEGPRALDVFAELGKYAREQPYGESWERLVHVDPEPKDRTGLGKAKTHQDLEHDRIEMQSQVQYLSETGVEARYGAVSVRAVRVFRYGKLAGVQLVLEAIGRDAAASKRFVDDVRALAISWPDVRKLLAFDPGLRMIRNDLVERKDDADFPKPPLRIQLEPIRK
ncbi:MAG: hypothetical protein HYV07_32875 [Deltaproteobacteria bacterium]|nr:hypothetical protein [Deltaproteobacteria bacterium]